MRDDSAKLVVALSRCHNLIFTLIEKNVRSYGLTVSEFGVLEALLHNGDMPVQKLCKKVLVTSGSMTYIVGKLEEKGYVKRRQCENDGRVWYVTLTEGGRTFISTIYPIHESFLKEILSELEAENKKELFQELFRMKKTLEKQNI